MAVNDDGSVGFDPAGWAAEAENRLTEALLVDPDNDPGFRVGIAQAQTAALVSIAQSLSALVSIEQERG